MCLTKDELIKYSRNAAGKDERTKIEHHLIQCSLCFEAYEGIALLDTHEDASYHLGSLLTDFRVKNISPGFSYKKYVISAAAVLLAAFSIFFLLQRESQDVRLFNKYFKTYPNVIPIVRGEGTDFNLKAALVLYNSGSYDEAIIEFDKILSTDPSNEIAIFYKGVSLLSLKKGEQAETSFTKLLSKDSGLLLDQAKWYLSLAYLLNNKENSAEDILESIAAAGNYYSPKAKYLLINLKNK